MNHEVLSNKYHCAPNFKYAPTLSTANFVVINCPTEDHAGNVMLDNRIDLRFERIIFTYSNVFLFFTYVYVDQFQVKKLVERTEIITGSVEILWSISS